MGKESENCEQNPTLNEWNEEDEKMIRIIEDAICTNEAQQLVRTKYGLELTDLADWLEKQGKPQVRTGVLSSDNDNL